MSVVSEAIAAARAATRAVRGDPVTYTRAAYSFRIARAVQAETNWDAREARPGVKYGEKSVDWLIDVDCLVDTNGAALRPQRGDTITTADGTVYRVMPFGPDNLLWEWHDKNARSTIRVFTKDRS